MFTTVSTMHEDMIGDALLVGRVGRFGLSRLVDKSLVIRFGRRAELPFAKTVMLLTIILCEISSALRFPPVRMAAPPTRAVLSDLVCETNSDCNLPKVCCEGLFFNFCCDAGGTFLRLPNRNASHPVLAS